MIRKVTGIKAIYQQSSMVFYKTCGIACNHDAIQGDS